MTDNSESSRIGNITLTERDYLSKMHFASPEEIEIRNERLRARSLSTVDDGRSANFSMNGCTSEMSRVGSTDGQEFASVSISGHECELCRLTFADALTLASHNLLVHRNAEESLANRAVVAADDVTASKKKKKNFECRSCGKCFSLSSYLSQHSRIHLGVKNYRCDLCDRRFTQMCHLQQHIRTHTGAKPYVCCHAGCDKSFSQLSNLQSHTRSHMTDKPFRCTSCYMCFADEPSLQAHIPRHASAKRNKTKVCTVCGKSYVLEKYLEQHFLKHHSGGEASVKNETVARQSKIIHNHVEERCKIESPSVQPQGSLSHDVVSRSLSHDVRSGSLSHDVRSMLQPNVVHCEQPFHPNNVQQPIFLDGSYFQNLVHNVQDLDDNVHASFILPLIGAPVKSENQLGGTADTQSAPISTLPADTCIAYTNGSGVHTIFASSNNSTLAAPALSLNIERNQRQSLENSSSMQSFIGTGPMNDLFPRIRTIGPSSAIEITTPSFNPSVNFPPTSHAFSSSISDHGSYHLDLINSVIFDHENAMTSSAGTSAGLLGAWMMPSSSSNSSNYNNYGL